MTESISFFRQYTFYVVVARRVIKGVVHRRALPIKGVVAKAGRVVERVGGCQQIARPVVSISRDLTHWTDRGKDLTERVVGKLSHIAQRIADAGAMIVGVVGIGGGLA